MVNVVSGGAYARAWGWRFVLIVAVNLGFPVIVYALGFMAGFAGLEPNGIFSVVVFVYLKPIIYLAFVASLAHISIARGKAIGMPGKTGVYIALLALSDLPFAFVFDWHWAVAFFEGQPGERLPTALLCATIAIATLSLARKPNDPVTDAYETAYRLWSALLLFLVACGILDLATLLSWFSLDLQGLGLYGALMWLKIQLHSLTLYPGLPLSLFAAASVYLVYASRKHTDGAAEGAGAQGRARQAFGLRRE